MAVLINFNGGVSVNMQDPTGLYGDNVFGDFAGHVEWTAGDLFSDFIAMHNAAADAEIWLDGAFTYSGGGGLTPSGTVAFLMVNDHNDMLSDSAFRMSLAFDTPVNFNNVLSAILASDPRPLWANQALTILGDVMNDTLVGGTKDDYLWGFGGNDKLVGGGGSDVLAGDIGVDNLNGGGGTDVLSGSGGKDVLIGGAGADMFLFDAIGNTNADKIKDFNKTDGDLIFFDPTVFLKLTGTAVTAEGMLATSAFKQANDITATAGATVDSNDRVLYNPTSGQLFYDSNGMNAGGRSLVATIFDAPDHHPTSLSAGDLGNFGVLVG